MLTTAKNKVIMPMIFIFISKIFNFLFNKNSTSS